MYELKAFCLSSLVAFVFKSDLCSGLGSLSSLVHGALCCHSKNSERLTCTCLPSGMTSLFLPGLLEKAERHSGVAEVWSHLCVYHTPPALWKDTGAGDLSEGEEAAL